MDDVTRERRKTIGRKIKRARLEAGYRSQRAFAAALGVDESSVGHAESGSARIGIGSTVFMTIEIELGWPDGCIERFFETGELELHDAQRRPIAELEPQEAVERAEAIARRTGKDSDGEAFIVRWAAERKRARQSNTDSDQRVRPNGGY